MTKMCVQTGTQVMCMLNPVLQIASCAHCCHKSRNLAEHAHQELFIVEHTVFEVWPPWAPHLLMHCFVPYKFLSMQLPM